MSQIKTIEQAAAKYSPLDFKQIAFLAGAKHQKELSDEREKLLMDVIKGFETQLYDKQYVDPNSAQDCYNQGVRACIKHISSVAKKLEGL